MARMTPAEWRKKKEEQKKQGTISSPAASYVPSGTITSGGTSSRMTPSEWKAKKATTSVDWWSKAGISLLNEMQSKSENWSFKDEYSSYSSRISDLLAQADKWRKQYAGNSEAVSYIDSLVDALSKAKSTGFSRSNFFSGFKDEEDYNFWDSHSTVEKRQAWYDEQQAKVDDLGSLLDHYYTIDLWYQDYQERPWDFTSEEIAEKLPLYEKHKAAKQKYGSAEDVKNEIAATKAEMRNYERGNYNENGRFYGSKVVDDNYAVTKKADFATTSANRDYTNATKEQLWDYDMSASAGSEALNNGGYFDEDGNIRDSKGNIVQNANAPVIEDKLGMFLQATEEEKTEAYNMLSSSNGNYNYTWGDLVQEGDQGSWKYLDETEIGIYYTYLEESQEKAYKFLSDMKTELNRRQTLDETGKWDKAYDEANFLEKIAMSAATTPAKFISNVAGFVEDTVNTVMGNEINPYSAAHSGMHYSQTVRGATAEELDKTGFKIPVIDFSLGDIYQTGMSRLDSALATSVFGGGGTVFLGMGAAQEEAYRLYQQGASAEQITLGSFAAGAAEAVFEYVSFDKLVKLDNADTIWKWVKNALIQGGIEASEEAFTEVSNIITNAVIMGQQSDLAALYEENGRDWFKTGLSLIQQTAQAAFGGFLGGFGAGAVQSGKSYINTQKEYANAGEKIIDSVGGTDALKNLANEVAGVSDAKMQKSLNKQTASLEKKETNRKVGKLYNTVKTAYNAQNKTDIVTVLEMNKFGSEQANAVADAIVGLASGNLTEQQAGILEAYKNNEHVQGVINSYDYDERSSIGKRNKAMHDFESGVAISMMAKQYAEKEFTPEGKYTVSSDGEAKALVTEEVEGKSITKDTGEIIDIKGVKEVRKTKVNGKTKIELILDIGDGKEINAENVAYANKNDALIYEAIANLGDNIDADTANKLISKFDGGNAMVFARGIAQAYTYGFYGLDRSEMKGKHTLSAELTEAQRNFAYGLGEKYRPVKDAKAKAEATVKNAPGEKGVYYRDKDGKATDIRTYLNETKIGLKDVQKTAIEVMEKMSEMLGVRFNVFESWVENGERYYLNEDGKVTKGNPNGFYDTLTGEIYIDLNAGQDYQGTMLFTVAHELTHFMRQFSPEQFTKIAKLVFQHGGMNGSVAKLAAIKQAKAKAKGKPISYDTAVEEVVADGMETILKDGKVLEFMEDVKKTDHEAWAKLKEWFKKLGEFLKKLVDAYGDRSAQTVEGSKVADFAENILNQIKQLYAEGAVAAGESYQMAIGKVKVGNDINIKEDVIDSSNTGISKEAKTGVKMQERTEFEAQPKQVFRVSTANGKAESKMLDTNMSVKELRDANFKENGFSDEEITKINGFIKEMADNMMKYRLKYKFVGLQNIYDAKIILNPMTNKIVLSAMVNNSDYSVNFDFTKICKKRVALQEVLETLAREKGKVTDGKVTEVNLSPANIKHINDILASYGVETACLCCFVESKRYNIQNYYQEKVVDVWNMLVDEVAPDAGYFNFADSDVDTSKIPDSEFAALEKQMKDWGNKTGKAKNVEQKMREFLADSPAARKKLRFSDLVTANGRTNLHKLYPEIESLILSKLGQSAPKSVEAFTPYNGEIDLLEATSDGDIVKYLYSIAGVRSQSFSDFMIAHVFDVLQKTASMSARKMPAHVYTKEIARAMLFGMTGEKHNMSVLHNVDPDVDSWSAGLSKDGEYNFSDYEAYKKGYSEFVQSIGWKDAVTLQNTEGYSKDCGIIGVGFSYNHMLKLHNDPEIRQVIGYHTSQMPVEVKPLTHLDKAADYTDVQNTKAFVGFAKPNYEIPEGVPSYATPPQDVMPKGNKKKTPKTTAVSDTFDIVGTFNKLSKGKTGDARTAAAKETLRQLLEYANDHGYCIKVAPGEAGKGEFDLYGDVQKTENPYLTTDHYIEYCIERGMLPMFFEFSMNPNYYKDVFDFNVFDRLSYNPETGLHEDSDGRKAYAPQTAVHMLNEDGSLAFPENFFDIVEKQMNSYNRYMQDVDSKMPSIMDEVRAVTNSTSKLSDRDFTYKELTAKNPLKGRVIDKNRTVKLTSDGSIDKAWVVAEVLKQCESLQTKAPLPTYYVNIPDIGKNVEITSKPIEHGFIKSEAKNGNPVPPRSMINARASLDLPHILQNSIEVNRSDRGDNAQVEFSHVLIGVTAMESANGTIEYYAVRSVVEARKNQGAILTEANVIGKLHAMNAKKIGKPHAQAGGNSTALTSSSLFGYSVADLLNDVKHKFDDTFSNDVYKHFGMTRRNSKFSPFLKFSDRDSDGNQLSVEQQKFFKDSVVRDANGNLMVMYHGTANGGAFTVFDGDQLDNSSLKSQIGQGFYFTNVKKEAESYMKNVDIYGRVSKGNNPNLHQVYLNITNPFNINADKLDLEKVKAVYMDGTKDHFFDSFIAHYLNNTTVNGRVFTKAEIQAMSKADRVSLYVDYMAQIGTKELLSNMVRAFSYGKQSALLTSMQNRLGYDGIVEEYAPGKFQYVAFSSEQVKYVDNKNPTSNPDIRYSDRDDVPTFYSQMAKVVDGVKQEKLGAASVVSMLRGKGVKAEEIKWSGIEEWLEGKKSVTKAELQEFIAGSMLQIEEEILSNEERPYSEEHQKLLDKHTTERDKIGETLAAEWKRITGEEFPIRNLGAGVSSDVESKIRDINLEHKKAAFEGRLLAKLRGDLKEVIANNDDFGFDSWKEALISIHRNRKDFITHYEMSSADKAVIVKYCNALNAYNEMPNKISDEDTDTLRDIAENIEKHNREIIQVRNKHYTDNAKYMAKWGSYKLKGGENYREVVFKIPGSNYTNDAMYVHWGEDRNGVLAHARIQDINTFIGKMLFIEEIQSDWHNEGHKSGYASDEATALKKIEDLKHQWDSLYNEMIVASATEARAISEKMDAIDTERASLAKKVRYGDFVPDAPFKDTYHEYVLKRLLRMAAEEGYDSIGWTPADTQMKRWNPDRKTNEQMGIEAKNPNAVAFEDGYRIEYDQDIPKFLNKYGKKWGTTVGKTVLDNGTEVWSMAITDSMTESVLTEGQALYQDRDDDSVSNRSLLANAFEGLAQNDIERNKIQEYRSKVALINEEERKLNELNAQIKELSFSKGPRDNKKIKALRFDAAQAANRINTYDKQLLRLEASKPLQDVLNREKRRAYKKAEERGKEALAEYKSRVEAKQKETTEKWRESRKSAVAKARETAEKRDARAKLQKLVLDTVNWITYPAKTDVKCPDILKKPYADFLNGIDLSSKRQASGGDPTKNDLRLANAMSSLATALDKIMISQDPTQDVDKVLDTGYLDLPADFVQKLRDMTESIKSMMVDGDYVVNTMTAAEVRQLSQMIRTLNHAIKTMSNLYANLRFANVEALGFDTMEFIDALGEIEKTGNMKDFVQWDNALPYYAFKRFGKGGESVFEGLMDAQDKLAYLAQEIFSFRDKSWTSEEAKAWSEDTHTIKLPEGSELTLTTADAMSIYCLSRREQGLQHLLGGGTRVLGIQKGSQKAKDSRSLLTIKDIDAINSSLTDRQRAVAEAIQEFMSTVCSEWGNEVSMKRFLTKEFTEKFYFPIESNDENLPVKDPAAQQSDLFRLLNISATKPLTPGANNEVIIRNIFDVFTGHASDMARLNAYGLGLLDYMKWLNYREKTSTEEGQIKVRGVRKSMQKSYGDSAMSYVLNLVKDVNGRPSDGGLPSFYTRMTRNAKTAMVGSSLRVATLQITSYPRAALVLSPKSLALGLSKLPQIDKAKKYCGIALWKSFGFYDTNISRSIEDQMKGVKDVKQKLIELSLKGAEWGDAITWGALWNACEYEVAQTTKHKVGSEEFYQEVGKKLREVVYRTQVVDSTLTRSEIMRSKNSKAQELSAFMSEPTLSANILMDAGFEFNAEKRRTGSAKTAWKKTSKYIGRAVAVYAIGQLAAALLEGLWDAWRDDDDEEFGKKFADAFIENLILDLLPFNKIPILSEFAEAALSLMNLGYFSSDNLSSTALMQTVSAIDAWKDALSGESSMTVYNALYKTTRAISSFLGVSISGVMREGVALWNNTAGAYDSTLKIRSWDLSKADLGAELYEAIISGNTRQADSLKAQFDDEASMHSAVRKALRENDPRIKEAAIAGFNGDPSERVRIARLIIADGFDQDDVVLAINAEINEMEPDEPAGDPKAKGLYTAEHFAMEIANGDQASAYEAKADIIATEQKNGKSEEEAVKKFNNSAKTALKKLFMAGELSEQEVINTLITFCDMEEEDAVKYAGSVAYEIEHPELDGVVTYSQYQRWESDGKPNGVSIEMFIDVAGFRDDGTSNSVKSQDEVALYIASVTSDNRLRHALWCCFYKASTSPWG